MGWSTSSGVVQRAIQPAQGQARVPNIMRAHLVGVKFGESAHWKERVDGGALACSLRLARGRLLGRQGGREANSSSALVAAFGR